MKILWISDFGVYTGFGIVAAEIISRLPEDWEFHILGVNYYGEPFDYEGRLKNNIRIYPAHLGGDMFGFGRVKTLVERTQPDVIFIFNDLWNVAQYIAEIKDDIPIVIYYACDAKPFDESWVYAIEKARKIVAYTNFGRSAITDVNPNILVDVIPHGVDTEKFFPIPVLEARDKIANHKIAKDDFVILWASRNSERKRVDLMSRAFGIFSQDKHDVKLMIHGEIDDPIGRGFHVVKLAERWFDRDKLILTSENWSPARAFSSEELNVIYNIADIGVNTSQGEGWGLMSMEHACTARGQIVPNSSAPAEIFPDEYTRKIAISHYRPYTGILTEGAVIDVDDLVQHLEFYYTNRDIAYEHGRKLREYFLQDKFSWAVIAKQWQNVFESCLA